MGLFVIVGCSDDEDDATPGNDLGSVADIDGNEYKIVVIGDQEWMAENLRVTRYNNGDAIPTGLNDAEWLYTLQGAYAIYPHDGIPGLNSEEEVIEAYGILYNWYAVNTGNLCPEGWSVPSDADWMQLVDYAANQGFPNTDVANGTGNALKSCRQVNSPLGGDCDTSGHPRWNSNDTHSGFDEFGFSALPGGTRSLNGEFVVIGDFALFWSSSEYITPYAWGHYIAGHFGSVRRNYDFKTNGFNVRCFRPI